MIYHILLGRLILFTVCFTIIKNLYLSLSPFMSFRIRTIIRSSIKELVLSPTLLLPDLPIQVRMCNLKSTLNLITWTKQHQKSSVQLPPVCSLHPVGELNQLRLSPHAAAHPVRHWADRNTSVADVDQR